MRPNEPIASGHQRSHHIQLLASVITEPVAAPQERAELIWDLNDLMEDLPPRCRKLLRLRYGLGYAPSEVAQHMGYHPSSVRKVAQSPRAAITTTPAIVMSTPNACSRRSRMP